MATSYNPNITMKRYALSLLTILPAYLATYAHQSLIVHLYGGTEVTFNLEDKPVISFDNGSLTVGGRNFALSDVSKYTFSQSSGIEGIDAGAAIMIDSYGNIIIPGNTDAVNVAVYDMNGHTMSVNPVTTASGTVSVSLAHLADGYYLIKIGHETLKIHKR